ncbi:gliding motility-associated C-terminal domain-containing protein [Flavobacterium psychrotolerans]|nr:gliding motility-associated C-terminal domain-containing protein [Flavobacterium psychrotolerans]
MRIITLSRKKIFQIFSFSAFFLSLTSISAQCPTVANSNQTFCDLQLPTIGNLVATPNGNGVVWYDTATSVTPLLSSADLINGEDYFADDNSGSCGVRQKVVVTIYLPPTGNSLQGPCVSDLNEATIANFTLVGNNIKWYSGPAGGSPKLLTEVLVNDNIYWASQTNPNTGCETSRYAVRATVSLVPVPTGNPLQKFCNDPSSPPTVANLVASGSNNWYSAPSGGFPLPTTALLVDGKDYYATTVVLPCESATRFQVTVSLGKINKAGTAGTKNICITDVAATAPFNLFNLLGGTPDNTGSWTGPLPTINGNLGTVDVSTLTLPGDYKFTYTVVGDGVCPQAPQTVTITVVPLPVASIAANPTVCSGSSTVVNFTGTPNATATYNVGGGANKTIVLDAGGNATLVTPVLLADVTYNLISVASGILPSCGQVQPQSIVIKVLPLPTVVISPSTTICASSSATVTFTGTPDATVTYTINGGSNQTIVLNSLGLGSIVNTYAATTTFTLVSIATAGMPSCVKILAQSITITVVDPIASVSVPNTTVCSSASPTLNFTGTPNAIVTYKVNGGLDQTIQLDNSGKAAVPTNYVLNTTITLVSVVTTVAPICSKLLNQSIILTVIDPTANVSVDKPIVCSADNNTILTFTGTPNAIITYKVNGGLDQTIILDGSGKVTLATKYGANTTITLVSVVTTGVPGCTKLLNQSITITVIDPTASVSINNATVCSVDNTPVTFTGTPNAIVTYKINGGSDQTIVLDGSGKAILATSYSVNTTITLVSVATTIAPICSKLLNQSITIKVIDPTASVSIDNTTVCSSDNTPVTFTGTPDAIVTYTVNGGANQTITLDGTGKATLATKYGANTTITLVSVATTGVPSCSKLLNQSVTITVIDPTASVSVDNATVCSVDNTPVTFTGTPNAIVTYKINGGSDQTIVLDGSGKATLATSYSVNTTITLVSVVTTGVPSCSKLLNQSITIKVVDPTASVTVDNTTVCSSDNTPVTFTGTPDAIVTYTVNGGADQTITLDGSGKATLATKYGANTTITLVSVVTTGVPSCSKLLNQSITISVIDPMASMSVDNTTICSSGNSTITFTGTPNAIVTYTVNGGLNQTITLNGSGTETLATNYALNTTIILVSVATTGVPSCSKLLNQSITITVADPTASMSVDNSTICSSSNATVTFTGTPDATVTYTINGGGSQTILLNNLGVATITNSYASPTTFDLVSITSSGTPGCSKLLTGSGSITVAVLPLPTADLITASNICLGSDATITFSGTPNATVTYTVNGGSDQSIVLDGAGTAVITTALLATTTYALVKVDSFGSPSCSNPLNKAVTININPLPTVKISSSNTAICSGNNASITFTGTPNSIVTYTINGANSSTINIGSSGVATLNIALIATSKFDLVSIALDGPPSCSQVQSGSTTINVTQPPKAGSNANLSICSGGGEQNLYLLLGSSAQAGGTWKPALASGTGMFDPKVDVSGDYIYTVSGTPPCANDTALVTVTILPASDAGIDRSANLCSNAVPVDLITFLGGTPQTGGTWSPALKSGTGVFDPSIDLAGTYVYTISGVAPCGDDTATITMTITPGPEAGTSQNVVFCQNSAKQDLFSLLGTTAQSGGTWSPALVSGSGIFDPSVDLAGVYTYTLSGTQPCDKDTATVTVTINPIPDAGIDNTVAICSNVNPVDLFSYLLGTPQSGGTWTPALDSGTGMFNPKIDTAGKYTYTVGSTFCTTDSAELTINITHGPDAGLPGTLTLCKTSGTQDLFASLKGAPDLGGTWSPALASGSGIFNPAVDPAGIYTYTLSGNQPCDNDTATVTVTVDPIPNAGTFVGVQKVCTSAGTFDLFTLLKDNQSGGVWTDGANLPLTSSTITISTFTPNTYSYTYTVTNLCGSDFETVQFTVLPNPVLNSSNIAVSSANCKGNNVTVSLSNMVEGSYIIDYYLSIPNELLNQSASVSIDNKGTGFFTINASAVPNDGTTTITISRITNVLSGCTTIVNPNITAQIIIRPSSNLENTNLSIVNICIGSDATVSISNAVGLPDGDYQFNYTVNTIPPGTPSTGITGIVNVLGGSSVSPFTIPASYLLTATNFNFSINAITSLSSGCNNLSEDANVDFQVFPIPNASGATLNAATACINFSNEVTISGANSLSDGYYDIIYQLSDASTATATVPVLFSSGKGSFMIPGTDLNNSGNVTVTISEIKSQVSSCGTSGSTLIPFAFVVTQLDTPILVSKGNEFCDYEKPTIANLSSNISTSETVVWYDAATGGTAYNTTDLLEDAKVYYAALKSTYGCESLIRLQVTTDLKKCKDLLIPDGFSPNNDNVNDTFEIKNLADAYPNFKLEIFNRYGNVLYKGNINTPFWDGTTSEGGIKLGDSLLPVGVYFYILEFNDGVNSPKQGRIYLSR